LDPLIKSQLASPKYQRLASKPLAHQGIANQMVTPELQTANGLHPAHHVRDVGVAGSNPATPTSFLVSSPET